MAIQASYKSGLTEALMAGDVDFNLASVCLCKPEPIGIPPQVDT